MAGDGGLRSLDNNTCGDGAPGGLDASFDNDQGWAEEMKTIED